MASMPPNCAASATASGNWPLRARDLVSSHTSGQPVTLYAVHYGKYAGRIVAQVHVGGGDLAALLLGAGLAREYDGGKRMGWCG